MLRVVTSRLARARQVQSQEGGGQAGLRWQIECTQRQFLGSARKSSSMVVVPTPTGPMELRKSTRDLKELSAGKEHTNEVSRSWRQKAWRWSQSVTSKLVANCFFFLNLRVFIKR